MLRPSKPAHTRGQQTIHRGSPVWGLLCYSVKSKTFFIVLKNCTEKTQVYVNYGLQNLRFLLLALFRKGWLPLTLYSGKWEPTDFVGLILFPPHSLLGGRVQSTEIFSNTVIVRSMDGTSGQHGKHDMPAHSQHWREAHRAPLDSLASLRDGWPSPYRKLGGTESSCSCFPFLRHLRVTKCSLQSN